MSQAIPAGTSDGEDRMGWITLKKKRFTYLFCSKEIRVRISEVFILFAFIYLEKLT